MINEMIVVTVTPFSGTTTPDKNGRYPVMLQCIGGTMPNRNVLSGTVADRAGIEVGKTYLMQVREAGTDLAYGQDFTFTKIKELTSGHDIAQTVKDIGSPRILTISRPENFDKVYQRKGDAVEGNRTKRIKEGYYEPAIQSRSADHETAKNIKDGTSVESQVNLTPKDLEKGKRIHNPSLEEDKKEKGKLAD